MNPQNRWLPLISLIPISQSILKIMAITAAGMFCECAMSSASVLEFTSKSHWQHAVGSHTTVGFTEYPSGTIITTQYAGVGVIFADGNERVYCCNFVDYPVDGAALYSIPSASAGPIHVAFTSPQRWLGVDYPTGLKIDLFRSGTLVYSGTFGFGMRGPGLFAGVIASDDFDAAVLTRPNELFVYIDDLHFGHPPPAQCADLNGDHLVNGLDLAVLLGYWSVPSGSPCTAATCPADFNGDGTVNGLDLAMFLGQWGTPGPGCAR